MIGLRNRWPTVASLLASWVLLSGFGAAVDPPSVSAQGESPELIDDLVPGTIPIPPLVPSLPLPSVPGPTPLPSPPNPSPPNPPPGQDQAPFPAPAKPAKTDPGPGREWTLTASRLTMRGSHFHGRSEQQVDGRKTEALHFTADRLEITDLVQRGDLGNGKTMEVASAPRRVSTVTDGPIELHVRQLSGTLTAAGYPLAPITLSPESPSSRDQDSDFLRLPDLTFTDAVAHNIELDGGTLFIPQARIGLR